MTKAAIVKTVGSRRRLIRNIVLVVLGLGTCAGVSFLAYMVLLAAIFGSLGYMFHSPKCDPSNIAGIESVTGVEIPRSASNLSSDCGGLASWWAEVQFDMNPSELNAFVTSTNVKLPLSATIQPPTLSCCDRLTDTIKSYLYGAIGGDEWFEEVFINTSNPVRYRVYFTLLVG